MSSVTFPHLYCTKTMFMAGVIIHRLLVSQAAPNGCESFLSSQNPTLALPISNC